MPDFDHILVNKMHETSIKTCIKQQDSHHLSFTFPENTELSDQHCSR